MSVCKKEYSHVGWIPCVSGYLFFDRVLSGLYQKLPSQAYVHKGYQSEDKYLLCHSIIPWKDIEQNPDTVGKYSVVLATQYVKGTQNIQGSIFVTSQQAESYNSTKNTTEDVKEFGLLASECIELHENKKLKECKDKCTATIDSFSKILKFHESISEKYHWKVKFSLDRYGFIHLSTQNKTISANATEVADLEDEQPTEAQQFDNEHVETILRQCFYYAKYTWHSHKHHNEEEDSHISIVSTENKSDAQIADELISSLQQSLVDINRHGAKRIKANTNGEGILAYCRSLVVSCNEVGWIDDNAKFNKLSHLKNIGGSITAQYATQDRKLALKTKSSDAFRNFLLFLLTAIAPSTLIYRENIQKVIKDHTVENDPFLKMMEMLYGRGYGPFISVVFLVALYFIAVWKPLRYFIATTKYGKMILDKAIYKAGPIKPILFTISACILTILAIWITDNYFNWLKQ